METSILQAEESGPTTPYAWKGYHKDVAQQYIFGEPFPYPGKSNNSTPFIPTSPQNSTKELFGTSSTGYSHVKQYPKETKDTNHYGNDPFERFGNHFRPWYSGFGFGTNTGFGSNGGALGTFLAGALLWNIATNGGVSNYQVYYNYTLNNTTNGTSASHENKVSFIYGNMTCAVIYDAKKFSIWAKRTIEHIEDRTDQAFQLGRELDNVKFNFTLKAGRIVHNETISITCCGTNIENLHFEHILGGKDPKTNCFHRTMKIPFRDVQVLPLMGSVTFN